MVVDLTQWTLERLTTKIQDDLELHSEIFIRPEDIKSFVNDAIDDIEELIIDSFSDFFLTFKDYDVEKGDSFIPIPDDIYEIRIRGLHYDRNSFNQNTAVYNGNWYKIKKQAIENVAAVDDGDNYQYRIVNSQTDGAQLQIFPDIREDSTGRFRLWYIRKALRLDSDDDVLERGLRPQFVISHAKVAILQKENNPYLAVEGERLAVQQKKVLDSLSRIADDSEDSYLRPDNEALFAAYGDGVDSYVGWGG